MAYPPRGFSKRLAEIGFFVLLFLFGLGDDVYFDGLAFELVPGRVIGDDVDGVCLSVAHRIGDDRSAIGPAHLEGKPLWRADNLG